VIKEEKIRVVISKVGLDGHDRGIRVVTAALREAGMEVIYLGTYQTPETVVQSALQEDADVIGLSYLSGGELVYTPKVIELMKKNRMNDVLLLVGGVFPKEEIQELKKMGVDEVFMGTFTKSIVEYVQDKVKRGRKE